MAETPDQEARLAARLEALKGSGKRKRGVNPWVLSAVTGVAGLGVGAWIVAFAPAPGPEEGLPASTAAEFQEDAGLDGFRIREDAAPALPQATPTGEDPELASLRATVAELQAERDREAQRQEAELSRRKLLDGLASDFEASVKDLVSHVAAAARQISASSSEVSATASGSVHITAALATAIDQTNSNVQSTAAATVEMTESLHELSRNVAQSSSKATETMRNAESTGRVVNALAEEAQRIGLIWRCVADDALATETQALAARLAALPAKALAETRRAFDNADRMGLDGALSLEADVQRRLGMSHDYLEGVSAFFAKRAPVFKDR